jgi:hypothetical protein
MVVVMMPTVFHANQSQMNNENETSEENGRQIDKGSKSTMPAKGPDSTAL